MNSPAVSVNWYRCDERFATARMLAAVLARLVVNGSMDTAPWYCCQLGAREHYAIPRALYRHGQLARLFTDAWVRPRALARRWNVGRYHPDLAQAPVTAMTRSLLIFELTQRLSGTRGWERTLARNQWFEREVLKRLHSLAGEAEQSARPPVLFAYSYAARDILRFAKQRGWRTLLGQIDPGPQEEEIVRREHARVPDLQPGWRPTPAAYWQRWHEECALADRIVVNSPWAESALRQQGIADAKMAVLPLSFESSGGLPPPKEYPAHFSAGRPLRVLFLGQINLRKGIARLLEAAAMLAGAPVEFWLVGPVQIDRAAIPPRARPLLRWFGPVARSRTADYFRAADVLILPTLSDGFALTQLEAMAQRLPIIASRRCGPVVCDGVNGLLLPEPDAEAIVEALRACWLAPARLAEFSRAASVGEEYGLSALGKRLAALSEGA